MTARIDNRNTRNTASKYDAAMHCCKLRVFGSGSRGSRRRYGRRDLRDLRAALGEVRAAGGDDGPEREHAASKRVQHVVGGGGGARAKFQKSGCRISRVQSQRLDAGSQARVVVARQQRVRQVRVDRRIDAPVDGAAVQNHAKQLRVFVLSKEFHIGEDSSSHNTHFYDLIALVLNYFLIN